MTTYQINLISARSIWLNSTFKGTVAWDGFFDHFLLYPRYRIRILKFFWFLSNFGCTSRIWRVRQYFSTTYEYFVRLIPCQMASNIRALRKQNAIKIFSLPNIKISLCVFSLCAKWVKSCPNSVNISTTWKNLRSFLSLIDRMQWAKKPSHAIFPLKGKKGFTQGYPFHTKIFHAMLKNVNEWSTAGNHNLGCHWLKFPCQEYFCIIRICSYPPLLILKNPSYGRKSNRNLEQFNQ